MLFQKSRKNWRIGNTFLCKSPSNMLVKGSTSFAYWKFRGAIKANVFELESQQDHSSVLVVNSVVSLVAVTCSRKGSGGMPPEEFLIQNFLHGLKMLLPISCLLLAIKTFKNCAASVLYKKYPSRWFRRHPHISFFPIYDYYLNHS